MSRAGWRGAGRPTMQAQGPKRTLVGGGGVVSGTLERWTLGRWHQQHSTRRSRTTLALQASACNCAKDWESFWLDRDGRGRRGSRIMSPRISRERRTVLTTRSSGCVYFQCDMCRVPCAVYSGASAVPGAAPSLRDEAWVPGDPLTTSRRLVPPSGPGQISCG